MQILGVFEKIYGAGADMTIDKALLISVVGFLIVFLILSVLALFVKAMGKTFDTISAKKAAEIKIPASAPETAAKAPSVPAGTPLPPDTSAGSLKLIGVTEEEAAVIMAIVSNQSGIPLNRLQFNSIKLTEEK